MTTMTSTRVEDIPAISRQEAATLATEEVRRVVDLLDGLDATDWQRPTECPGWDVRALAAHVLGMLECFSSTKELVSQMRAASAAAKRGEVFIDAMTAKQVADRAHLGETEVVDRIRSVGPRAARWRRRFPLRFVPMDEEVDGKPEKWRMGYLLDVILNRDTWMHRVDLARATGRELELTADHDGRLVAEVVAEWARRHGRPFTLELDGPAGGLYVAGGGGDDRRLDAVEFCRTLSGRAAGDGLLAQAVPF
jgi:uncharacterized protein (TIGR03083 family)